MARKKGCIKEKANKFVLTYRGQYYGIYDTYDEAEKSRLSLLETYEPVDTSFYIPLFWDRLNAAIGKKDMSITDICKVAGINRTNLTHYQNGTLPSLKVLVKLALTLNVSTDWLLGLER